MPPPVRAMNAAYAACNICNTAAVISSPPLLQKPDDVGVEEDTTGRYLMGYGETIAFIEVMGLWEEKLAATNDPKVKMRVRNC